MILADASALIAFILNEAGAEFIATIFEEDDVAVSSVTWAEVQYSAFRYRFNADPVRRLLSEFISFTPEHAQLTDRFFISGLSLGDRCCLATALALNVPVLTGDRAWQEQRDVAVRLIR